MTAGGLRHDGDEDKFVVIPRPTIRDDRLSFRARGLLAFILDLPPGFDVSATFLVRQGREGREAVYAALRELRAAGYYRVEKRPASGGRWVTGTAVSKFARPSWAAEFEAQEAARLARREEPVPVYEPPVLTDGEDADTSSDLRVPGVREPDVREPDAREPVVPKEELPRRTDEDGNSGSSSHLSTAAPSSPAAGAVGDAAPPPRRPVPPATAEVDPSPRPPSGPPAELGGPGHAEFRRLRLVLACSVCDSAGLLPAGQPCTHPRRDEAASG